MSSLQSISSRHRNDMATLFDVFCEIGTPDETGLPSILTKYPEDYNDETVLRSARQFSFPCGSTALDIETVQLFNFVLTDSEGKFTFGFCRYTPRNNTCLCILSGFPWDAGFYKILNHISLVMNNGSQADLDLVLTKIYHTDIPNIGDAVNFDVKEFKLAITIPDPARLPTLREDKYMLEFFNAVPPRQMIAIYASLLKERRIIFTSRKLSQLSSCICAAATLINPMIWQSVFIPVLPAQLIDMVMAPMPFLIGVPKQVLAKAQFRELGDVVIVDLEEKKFQSAHDDVAALPLEVSGYLKRLHNGTTDMGDYLSRTFLRATVLLFGGYRLGFTRNEAGGNVGWDREKYVAEQRPTYQPFLGSLLGADGVQYLERFIEERLRYLNSGIPKNDEFEKEITNIERNRPQVKENASDVIGVLKDKVTGIQIGSKISKLAQKDIRRPKTWKRQNSAPKTAEPLSFDNIQWQEPEPVSSDSSRAGSPKSEVAAVGNLIDLDSPMTAPTDVVTQHDLFAFKRENVQLWDPRSSNSSPGGINPNSSIYPKLPPVPPRPIIPIRSTSTHSLPTASSVPSTPSSSNPFSDPFATPEKSGSVVPPTWERFD